MIESIRIEDLGVIEQAELDFSPGLTALTGETGAGKTMVLTSLGLLLGQRAAGQVVRSGSRRAVVEGAFVLDPASRPAARAQEAGGELDDDVLLVSRSVPAQGRSRAYLGGRTVPSSVLAEVGEDLVSVHGQADQLRLRSSGAQRAALDAVGGAAHAAVCRRYAVAYADWRQAHQDRVRWGQGEQARREEVAVLRSRLAVVEELDPRPGEDVELTAEALRLDHAEDLRRAASLARAALAGDEDAVQESADAGALVAHARRALEETGDVDPVLQALSERLGQVAIDVADVAEELGDYLGRLAADPARLAWVQDRRGALARACRELSGGPLGDAAEEIDGVDALLEASGRWAARLAELDGPVDRGQALDKREEECRSRLLRAAGELTVARQELAQLLQERVSGELAGLHMAGARLLVDLEPLDEPGPTGSEQVRMRLQAHPGAPALPLGRGASGGELSRIMLALEVVLADAQGGAQAGDGSPQVRRTLVFDEIDAGVGGRAAGEIGRRLARLARTHQVVVVTHLAQVAAWADRQLVVSKRTDAPADEAAQDPVTRTSVTEVRGPEREAELARMLSGHDSSQAALQHAAELLAEAAMAQSTL